MIMRTCGFLVILLLSVVRPLQAQELDAAATWTFRPENGVLVIHYYRSLAEAGPEVKNHDPLVFFSLVDVDSDGVSITGARSKEFVCQFKKDRLEVTLEPGVPNVNLVGSCGAAITGLLSLKRNGETILNEEPFENLNCLERERFIEVVTFRDGSAKPEIRYGSYNP
jgi:hypothetical protein